MVEAFQDTGSGLRALTQAAEAASTDPKREEKWERARELFEKQAGRMSAAADAVSLSLCSHPKTAWEIQRAAKKLAELTQQTVFASKVLLMNPDKKVRAINRFVLFIAVCSVLASEGPPGCVEGGVAAGSGTPDKSHRR